MIPDFHKGTIDTLAKRAGFICSNPDCRVKTVGPNTAPDKATLIGEAAHIYGARPSSKRYTDTMTDSSRAEITNAIWLCRNCHKLIDSDERKYTCNLLFRWRELHENYIITELGNKSALIESEQLNLLLDQFNKYPAIVKRIVIDKPIAWEFRLTAELMRYLNGSNFRKIRDLQHKLYLRKQNHIKEEEAFRWIRLRITEATNLVDPITNLIDQLNKSWGDSGLEGDVNEIHHICRLISDYTEQVVDYEEMLMFTNVPEEYQKLKSLLHNLVGAQALKIESIPQKLDELVALINERVSNDDNEIMEIKETLVFELPKGWSERFDRELKRVSDFEIGKIKSLNRQNSEVSPSSSNNGCTIFFVIIAIILIFMMLL